MKLDRKTLMIIGGVLLAVGVGVYFWRKRKSEGDSVDGKSLDVEDVEETGNNIPESDTPKTTDKKDVDIKIAEDIRYNTPINPLLSKIKNKKVASYLSKLLSEKDIIRLRGWLDLINKDKAKDPSKWGDSSGLKGEVSIIGHALYQMNEQNKKNKTPFVQSRNLWSAKILTDLQDAQ
jgi:hypothetical protein